MRFSYPRVATITPDMRGFYLIDHDAYHQGIGLSSSTVKRALKSYEHYTAKEQNDTAALAFGRAFHSAILEPDDYAKRYTVMPRFDGHPNSNAYKAAKQEWVDANQGRETIAEEDRELIAKMVEAVKSHPSYPTANYGVEVMACHPCPITGELRKCKADMIAQGIIDFKTTSGGLTPSEVMSTVVKYGMHVSAAYYCDIFREVSGHTYDFTLALVTKKDPIEVEFYRLSDEVLDHGRQLYQAGLKRIAKWKAGPVEAKQTRVLLPTAKLVYSTQDTLDYIGEK